jgi:hypothetical protein
MGKFLAVVLLLSLLIPVDGQADLPVNFKPQASEIVDTPVEVVHKDACVCECDSVRRAKRPVLRAIRSIKVRKFLSNLIGAKK